MAVGNSRWIERVNIYFISSQNSKVTMVKAFVLLSTFLILCAGAAHAHPEGGTTCDAGTMEAAVEAARKLADDGEREAILGALEKIKAGKTQLVCVRRERCRLPAHPPAAAAAAPPLHALQRHPLARSLARTMHAHTRPPAVPPAHRRTSRSLFQNKIGDAGAAALAKALPTSQLTHLQYVHAPLPPPPRCLLCNATRSPAPSRAHARSHPPARRAIHTPPHAAQLDGVSHWRCWNGGSRQGATHEPAHYAGVRARAAAAAPPLPALQRHPLARSLARTCTLTPARPPRPPHAAARRAA
jgi:hypothetical protein